MISCRQSDVINVITAKGQLTNTLALVSQPSAASACQRLGAVQRHVVDAAAARSARRRGQHLPDGWW